MENKILISQAQDKLTKDLLIIHARHWGYVIFLKLYYLNTIPKQTYQGE